jgi:EAL domain-containing protein (putative c-di-GMP-specific phosphodiesterase class I)
VQSHAAAPAPHGGEARAPLCFVVDSDASIRQFLSLVLHGCGIDTQEFAEGPALGAALARQAPDLIFLDIALEAAQALACLAALGTSRYRGKVQLMSARGGAVLAQAKSIGEHHHLEMLPVLRKPFETGVILKLLQEIKLGDPPAVAGRVDLEEALAKNWIEFWYQPKIDLRKKQLVGAEAFARARHPTRGILLPAAFMPGAKTPSLVALSERALTDTLNAGLVFAKLGVSLQMAVNVPVEAVDKLPIAEIVGRMRPQFDKWPGLVIDLAEEQIIPELALANNLAKTLRPLGVTLAIDDCGRALSALSRLPEFPFAELKLDGAFVADCGTDRVNAPLCKTVIDLAHNLGAIAVAIGIEKASDALALVSMGCDCGQGFLLGQPMPEERFTSLLRQRSGTQKRSASAA